MSDNVLDYIYLDDKINLFIWWLSKNNPVLKYGHLFDKFYVLVA